jgi:hypothetical protein
VFCVPLPEITFVSERGKEGADEKNERREGKKQERKETAEQGEESELWNSLQVIGVSHSIVTEINLFLSLCQSVFIGFYFVGLGAGLGLLATS